MKLEQCIFLVVICLCITACGSKEKASVTVGEEYSERFIRESRAKNFSIVLNDMNVTEQDNKRHFQHKYHILKVEDDSLKVDSLDWKTVNEDFFRKHENNLGMEIVSNHNNTLSRIAKPVGYDWAVGNDKYGKWESEQPKDSTQTTTSNRRVWRPHTSGLFWYWMLRRPAYQRDYISNRVYNASGRTYYGRNTSGRATFGTNSTYQQAKRSSFFTRKSNSSSWTSFTTSKKSASSSRYSSGSTTRSRSGGFGK